MRLKIFKMDTMDSRNKGTQCRFCNRLSYKKMECTSRKAVPIEEIKDVKPNQWRLEPGVKVEKEVAEAN